MDFDQFSAQYDAIYAKQTKKEAENLDEDLDALDLYAEEAKAQGKVNSNKAANPNTPAENLHFYIPQGKESYGFKAYIVDSKGEVKSEEYKIYKDKEVNKNSETLGRN